MKKYNHVAVAGTFDRLHKGHKKLIDETFSYGQTVSIGIVDENLLEKKLLSSYIEDFETRKENVIKHLKNIGVFNRAKIFILKDIYGIAKHDKSLQALLVTNHTYRNAAKINSFRKKNNLPSLDIIKIPFLKSTDGKIISSERIRAGEIDRAGFAYLNIFKNKPRLVLPESLRATLREPLGAVIGNPDSLEKTSQETIKAIKKIRPSIVVSVGDIISWTLSQGGLTADIQIVDLKSRRKHVSHFKEHNEPKQYVNKPGTVSFKFVQKYKIAIKNYLETGKKELIVVSGEEDLTGLPAILIAPLGGVVVYGHFERGVIMVEVTEKKKEEVKKILQKFV